MEGFVAKLPAQTYGTPIAFFTFAGTVLLFLALYGYLHRAPAPATPTPVEGETTTEAVLPIGSPSPRFAPAVVAQTQATPNASPGVALKNSASVVNTQPGAPMVAPTVTIEFELVNRDALDKLTRDGEGRISVGQYGMTVVPQFREKFNIAKNDPGFHALDADSRSLIPGQPSMVFRGGREPKTNEAIGLSVEATYLGTDASGGSYHLNLKRALPDFSNPSDTKIATQASSETFKLAEDAAAVFVGLVSHRGNFVPGEEELYRGNVLRAFLDNGFQRGDSDIVVIFAPQPTGQAQPLTQGAPYQAPPAPQTAPLLPEQVDQQNQFQNSNQNQNQMPPPEAQPQGQQFQPLPQLPVDQGQAAPSQPLDPNQLPQQAPPSDLPTQNAAPQDPQGQKTF